jgi:hypothetical protein
MLSLLPCSRPVIAQENDVDKDRRIAELEKEVAELQRNLEWQSRKLVEMELNIETKDNRISDMLETRTRLLREKQKRIAQILEDHQRSQRRMEQNILQYEKQVTDLRQYIKNLAQENKKANGGIRERDTRIADLEAQIRALSRAAGPVAWIDVERFGVSLKVPGNFKRNPAGGKDSVQYMYMGGVAFISIETGKLGEEGLEGLYKKEYLKRQRDTIKRMKRKNAYEIIKKEDITLGGRNAFEIEQEFQAGAGDLRTHCIVINVDLGDGKLLTVKWEVPDVNTFSWEKAYSRYFKESRACLR